MGSSRADLRAFHEAVRIQLISTGVSCYREKYIQVLIMSLTGNPVRIGGGPAAVIGDESRISATVLIRPAILGDARGG